MISSKLAEKLVPPARFEHAAYGLGNRPLVSGNEGERRISAVKCPVCSGLSREHRGIKVHDAPGGKGCVAGLRHETILAFLDADRGGEVEARFWNKVTIAAPDACWDWTAGTNAKGYGRFKIASREVRHANRVAWTIANRREPGEFLVRHSCDRPVCCNPSHLLLGTTLDNSRDMTERGRGRTSDQRGANNNCTSLTLADIGAIVTAIRQGLDNVDIAARYPVGHSMISRIRTGRSWQTEAAQFGWGPAIAFMERSEAA